MNNTNALRISINAVLVFVLFQKLNQFLCAIWGYAQIQNEIPAPSINYLGYALAGIISLAALFGLYNLCIEQKNESNWGLVLLAVGIIAMITANIGINWVVGGYLAENHDERELYAFDRFWLYSNKQSWIIELAAAAMFLVKLIKKKEPIPRDRDQP